MSIAKFYWWYRDRKKGRPIARQTGRKIVRQID